MDGDVQRRELQACKVAAVVDARARREAVQSKLMGRQQLESGTVLTAVPVSGGNPVMRPK